MKFFKSFVFFLIYMVWHIPITSACRVETLGGTQPEPICIMRDFLKAYEEQTKPSPEKNALFIYGPLGTGKTFAAQAIGKESDTHVIYYNLETKIQEGAWIGLKIKELYEEAEQVAKKLKKPVIVILDNIDELCENDRGRFSMQQKEALLEVCQQIRQHAHCSYLMTVLATAKAQVVPGELIKCTTPVKIDVPNFNNRFEIIKFYAKRQKIDLPDAVCKELANNYSDFPGRYIEVAFRTARFSAISEGVSLNEKHIRAGFARKRRLQDVDYSSIYIVWRNFCEAIGAT